MLAMSRSTEATVRIESAAETVFAYLDDHRHLGAHMSASSWMMLGSKMDYEFDAGEARSVGSKFGFRGKILGIALSAEQVVSIRIPPRLKVWETIGVPNLWVIDRYRLGFEIVPEAGSCRLRVFIDYDLPETAGPVARPHLCECLCTLVHGSDGERRSPLFREGRGAASPERSSI